MAEIKANTLDKYLIAFVEGSRNAFLSQVLWDGGPCIVRFGPCIEVATVICIPANSPGFSGSLQVFHQISRLEREKLVYSLNHMAVKY